MTVSCACLSSTQNLYRDLIQNLTVFTLGVELTAASRLAQHASQWHGRLRETTRDDHAELYVIYGSGANRFNWPAEICLRFAHLSKVNAACITVRIRAHPQSGWGSADQGKAADSHTAGYTVSDMSDGHCHNFFLWCGWSSVVCNTAVTLSAF